jgi:hypothetical protein
MSNAELIAKADRALEDLPGHVSPGPWTFRQFGYERFAILDANGAEVAEVTRRGDAERICEARADGGSWTPGGAVFDRVCDQPECTSCGPWTRIDVDRKTGLCLNCWRCWRFSPVGVRA